MSCSSWSFPYTRMSSMRHTTPSRPCRISDIRRWKCSGADVISNGRWWKQNLPKGVMEVVRRAEFFVNAICQNLEFALRSLLWAIICSTDGRIFWTIASFCVRTGSTCTTGLRDSMVFWVVLCVDLAPHRSALVSQCFHFWASLEKIATFRVCWPGPQSILSWGVKGPSRDLSYSFSGTTVRSAPVSILNSHKLILR